MEGVANEGKKKDKEKITDPHRLRRKLQNIDAKIDALKAKKEEVIRQLYALEQGAAGGAPPQPNNDLYIYDGCPTP